MRWRIALSAMAVAGSVLSLYAEQTPPTPTSQPSGWLDLSSAHGAPVARLRVDPRGIGALFTADEPGLDWVIPRRDHAWHYREWQWWKGHPWGDQMRPRYWGEPRLHLEDADKGCVRIDYTADGFRGTQQFLFPQATDRDEVSWDLVTTLTNRSGANVAEYGQFFACYTPINQRKSSFFWDESGRLVSFERRGVGHLDGYIATPRAWFFDEGAVPHCPRGGGRIVGAWRHPVLVSHASPGGWRSVILVEEAHCAAVTQGMEGNAMDYILYPGHGQRVFREGDVFSVHIRNVLIRSPDVPKKEALERLWSCFVEAHDRIHRRAEALRRAAAEPSRN